MAGLRAEVANRLDGGTRIAEVEGRSSRGNLALTSNSDQPGAANPGLTLHTDFAPTYGAPQAVARNVVRIVCENPSPFTFKGTGTLIVTDETTKQAVVVDPGPENAAHLAALTGALAGYTLRHILVTHTHRDHSPLARVLQETAGGSIMGCAPYVASAEGAGSGLDASNDTDYAPDEEMADGDTIGIGSRRLTAVATPGHTANHLCFALDEDILLCGDHVMGWSTTVIAPPDGHMGSYMASLEKLGARAETRYLPAHGAMIEQPHRFVRGLITHRRQRETQIRKRLEAGDHTIAEMVPRLYPQLDTRLHRAAALSVRAHLDDLVERGEVVSDGADRFRLR